MSETFTTAEQKARDWLTGERDLDARQLVRDLVARNAELEVACAQAVEFATYVEGAAKGTMVERAKHFMSQPFAQELAARLAVRTSPGEAGLLTILDLLRTDRDGKKWDCIQSAAGSMVDVSKYLPRPQPAPPAAAPPIGPETMAVQYNPATRALWHTDCENHFGGIMKWHQIDERERRTLVECLHCGRRAYIRHGHSCGSVEVIARTPPHNPDAPTPHDPAVPTSLG